ncbi:glycoside hydrolase family 13 protein [Calycina marina]|uniref:alpha-1,3-glucan synthase n=1 Tax=Calycina marina TaxID=1763456 RepID=A0A9P8CF63_9HELO|nr:glycoside hydrolase family 13 protein [Calycina marina]
MTWKLLTCWLCCLPIVLSLPYLEEHIDWNLNQNQTATDPLDYWGQWDDHVYQESPDNWRMPFYTITLDRYVNGDPSNDDANGTQWEHDPHSNQFRFGGDIKGLEDTLDYLQGMGIKALYLAGTPFINEPWSSDGYSPLDLTLLDAHHGTIAEWRAAIDEIHSRGMYVVMDNTMATMGDLMGFEGYLNDSTGTPFAYGEHDFIWKSERRYWDFHPSNDYNESCEYPDQWLAEGDPLGENITSLLYGEVNAFGDDPDWVRQLSKFAYVQDRLREWVPSVRAKLERFSCITIAMLDIDGYRMDKGVQITIDAQAAWSASIRECARSLNKTNFMITGEVVDGNTYGALYAGRGKLADQQQSNLTLAVLANNETSDDYQYMRDFGNSALDASSFHYSIYRALTIFLGLDGEIGAVGDTAYNFVTAWHEIVATNDLVNANTGVYDPRHLYGVTNQDVFRWPSLSNGTQRQLMGNYISALLMPGSPLLVWGEEQAFYVLDSQATNYVFGRQPIASAQAWQMHGCYKLGIVWYTDMPWESGLVGCNDDSVSLDHRDPSHPVRNILKRMLHLRESYPVLNDGFELEALSNKTYGVVYFGSGGRSTEYGVWSTLRSRTENVQDLSGVGQGNQSVWLIYTNQNTTVNHEFDCSSDELGLISPFPSNTTVKNLFYPYEEYNTTASVLKLGYEGSTDYNGCIGQITLRPWEFMALVPIDKFVEPLPVITKVVPSHDSRITSSVSLGEQEVVAIEIHFSANMSCDSVTNSFTTNSTTQDDNIAQLDTDSVQCSASETDEVSLLVGGIPTAWIFKANLVNVSNGVHRYSVSNSTSTNNSSTGATDHFMFRIGQPDNPIVFPKTNITSSILHKDEDSGNLYIEANAAGADKFRYSLNWGSTYSSWYTYNATNVTLAAQAWSGTKLQEWKGEHVIVQYWGQLIGSSDHFQHAELIDESLNIPARQFPHIFTQGAWNEYGLDAGLPNEMTITEDNLWIFNFMAEWPATIAFNVWGINPDKQSDESMVLGDIDGDGILDRIPPITLLQNNVSIEYSPSMPYLSWRISLDDSTLGYTIVPSGSAWHQILMFVLMAIIPPLTGIVAIILFRKYFYGVKHNKVGVTEKFNLLTVAYTPFRKLAGVSALWWKQTRGSASTEMSASTTTNDALAADIGSPSRRKVLIATMEYEIEDWNIKIKIGGLGVMASLMGKNLGHQDLIWVVPCVGGIEYPEDTRAEPMTVTIMGAQYDIQVQYHIVRNITYVLVDAPVFRAQTKSEPYPARMDDADSAIYYSAWNQCVAEAMRRYNPDIYHINDYHGTVAPLYLLPRTIPVCLSLHNAEFQGLWPMRTKAEIEEVCSIYNLTPAVAKQYVQFGEVFNLLHAGASYLRVHQRGFGAVGVSKKYGVRSFARYSIFWGLSKIGALPNPDPSDQASYDKKEKQAVEIVVNVEAEAARGALRVQAQEWAGLQQDTSAELFVFVGRWSMQKGIDLIADVFPAVLENNPKAQLICVGPVIDLYGKFAAMKFATMMEKYPGRVFSKPEFTMLPPFIFSGAEFALIPSRDEPFGLVAVEFGRKGALGVGARVGGLGQMPGWWFTIESTTTKHLINQFKMAIQDALSSGIKVRELMRARSALQRFPVAQWVEDLGILQSTAVKLHGTYSSRTIGKFDSESIRSTVSLLGDGDESRGPSPEPRHGRGTSADSEHSQDSVGSTNVASAWFGPSSRSARQHAADDNNSIRNALRRATERIVGSAATTPSQSRSQSQGHSRSTSTHRSHPNRSRNRLTKNYEMSSPNPSRTALAGFRQRGPSTPNPGVSNTAESVGIALSVDENGDTIHEAGSVTPHHHRQVYFSESRSSSQHRQASASLSTSRSPSLRRHASSRNTITAQPSLGDLINREAHNADYTADVGSSIVPSSRQSRASSFSSVAQPKSPHLDEFEEPRGGLYSIVSGLESPRLPFAKSRNNSSLSLASVVGEKTDMKLQAVDPSFVDSTGLYAKKFQSMLTTLDGKSAEDKLCIEDYLKKSEKHWYGRFHDAKLGRPTTPATSFFQLPWGNKSDIDIGSSTNDYGDIVQFGLAGDHVAPTGVRRLMLQKIGDWPIYAFLLAFGQIIAANSYQITLLIGQNGQEASELYVVASIYLAASIFWWLLLRNIQAVYILSAPFLCYGLAFFLVGMVPYIGTSVGQAWMQNVATALYAIGSASGSIFFAQNFGSEGGVSVDSWAFRACVIQGTQQIYVSALWYWGSSLSTQISNGVETSSLISSQPIVTAVTTPIAVFMWAVGLLIYFGLPNFYRQKPGTIPSFYRAVTRRKIILWFLVMVILQNYWMSATTGRSWAYLWSSNNAPAWAVLILVIFFFICVWAALLCILGILSKIDSWIIPVFAIGLGAPRWCQMLWGVSNIGLYLPWAGSSVASALLGRTLWLWLGVLDTVQGVGFGMILLQTLTRLHFTFTLIAAQVVGSLATIAARATAPNKIGPGTVFPDFSGGQDGLKEPAFWLGLLFQGVICIGFFVFFRKEQLFKP